MDQKQRSAGTRAGLIAGPAVAVIMLASGPLPLPGLGGAAWDVAALTAWMAIWWVSEAVPLVVTALLPLPLPLLPLPGVSGIESAAAPYASPLVFLFLWRLRPTPSSSPAVTCGSSIWCAPEQC